MRLINRFFVIYLLFTSSLLCASGHNASLEEQHPTTLIDFGTWKTNLAEANRLGRKTAFSDDFFLKANENPRNRPFLDPARTPPGLAVSTGAKRSFHLLNSCPSCTGLVVCDINPLIILWIHAETMVLRLANDFEHYQHLRTLLSSDDSDALLAGKRLLDALLYGAASRFPEHVCQQYSHLLRSTFFDEHYYRLGHKSFFADFAEQYDVDPTRFARVQSLAKNGHITAFVRGIEDLSFLVGRTIAAIDVSNIADYTLMNIRGLSPQAVQPWLLWTIMSNYSRSYIRSLRERSQGSATYYFNRREVQTEYFCERFTPLNSAGGEFAEFLGLLVPLVRQNELTAYPMASVKLLRDNLERELGVSMRTHFFFNGLCQDTLSLLRLAHNNRVAREQEDQALAFLRMDRGENP
jgi:hypothetical protein